MTTTDELPSAFDPRFPVPRPIVPRRVSSKAIPQQPLDPLPLPTRSAGTTDEFLALLSEVQSAGDLPQSWQCLCDGMRRAVGCERVALGVANHRGACRLVAVSGSIHVDRRSELVLASEAAMDETIRSDKVLMWSASGSHESPIFRRLVRLASADVIAGFPLRTAAGKAVGVLLLLGRPGWASSPSDLAWLTNWQRPLSGFVELLRQARGNFSGRLQAAWKKQMHRVRGRVFMAAVAVVGAVLLVPMPYKLKCDCLVEPVRRRFVSAPFAGTLDKTLVEVGEVVRAGQVLAAMDERELRWELAGLDAEYAAAKKKRDSALAGQEGAALQLASLEMERLNTKIQTLRKRAGNLQIQCPIDGVVVSGDLKRTEGAPLAVGQTLFEIAPLEQMITEMEVPQEEIAHLHEGMSVELQLDAFPGQAWSSRIAKIHPRAELRNGHTAFIAEVHLDNDDGRLRPGMSGRAKIITPPRSLGWIWFHRPINALAQRIGW